MKILGVEFSTNQKSVAVLADGVCVSALETGRAINHPFELISRVLQEARLEREQIECLAIGVGPGSYHGIRVAISIAQGWSLARPVKLVGVSSIDAMAFRAIQLGWDGEVSFVIDAQRNECYLADYILTAGSFREVSPLRIVPAKEISQLEPSTRPLAGPDLGGRFKHARNIFPDAESAARLGADATHYLAPEKLEPIYLRETAFVKAPPPRNL